MNVPPAHPPTPVAVSPHHTTDAPAPLRAGSSLPLTVDSHGYHYAVSGNTLLAPARVAAILHGAATPTAAIGALKQAYAQQGYFLVAVLASVEGQQVRVDVVQGRLQRIEGPHDITAFFAPLVGRDTLRNSDVLRQGLLAQAYAATDGEQPQLAFTPAPEAGGSLMRIDLRPLDHPRTFSGSLTAGNLGNRYAGHDLAQLQGRFQHHGITVQATHSRALTGFDADSRGAYYAATDATVSAVTPAGWFQLDGNRTRYRLGQAFAPLDPAGEVKVFGGSATTVLFADDTRRWTVAAGVHRVHDRETVFGGAYALRDRRYGVLDLGTQASWRFSGIDQRSAHLSIAGGIKFGGLGSSDGFSPGTGAAVARFRIYTAQVGLEQSLARGYSVRFDASAQDTGDTVPSYEQWVLGGLHNLTAYLPGTLVGDRGYLGRFTLQAPSWQVGSLPLQTRAFAEYGASSYDYVAPGSPRRQALDDVGASLNLDLPRLDAHAMLAYAEPVGSMHVPAATRHRQQAHLFFTLQVDL